jgi:arabinofuranosyltransferase
VSGPSETDASPDVRRNRLLILVVPGVLAILAVGLRMWQRFWIFDDAFITFRYATNIARGLGFVFNEGERVLGTTTPLYTLILAFVARIGGAEALPGVARGIGALADAGTTVVLYALSLRIWSNRAMATCTAVVFLFSPLGVIHGNCGMESSLFAFLMLFALERFTAERHAQALTLGAIALLTRPEAVLVLGMLGVGMLLKRRRVRWVALVPGAVLLLAWCVFAWAYFGGVTPNSMRAKWHIFNEAGETSPVRRILAFSNLGYVRMFWGSFLSLSYEKEAWKNFLPFILVLGVFVLGAREVWIRRRDVIVVPLFAILFSGAYSVSSTQMFTWYLVPLIAPMFFGLAAGVKSCGDQMARRLARDERSPLARAIPVLFLVVFCLPQVAFWGTVNWGFPCYLQNTLISEEREETYRQAARLIEEDGNKERKTVMATEIGALGFEGLDLRIIDVAGLVTPEMREIYAANRAINNRVSPLLLERFRPDYVVCLKEYFSADLTRAPEKTPGYEVMRVFTGNRWGEEGLYVLRRRAECSERVALRQEEGVHGPNGQGPRE